MQVVNVLTFEENDRAIEGIVLEDGSICWEVELAPGLWAGAVSLEESLELAASASVVWR